MKTLIFALFLSQSAIAAPIVTASFFKVGDSFAWDYFEKTGAFYSGERYTVIEVNGSKVKFEMGSKFSESAEYIPHHRFEADVAKCVNENKTWHLRMWYLNGSVWEEYSNPKTLPFEEKFNCRVTDVAVREVNGVQLVQTKERGSWYGPNAVAVEKSFKDYDFKFRP